MKNSGVQCNRCKSFVPPVFSTLLPNVERKTTAEKCIFYLGDMRNITCRIRVKRERSFLDERRSARAEAPGYRGFFDDFLLGTITKEHKLNRTIIE